MLHGNFSAGVFGEKHSPLSGVCVKSSVHSALKSNKVQRDVFENGWYRGAYASSLIVFKDLFFCQKAVNNYQDWFRKEWINNEKPN